MPLEALGITHSYGNSSQPVLRDVSLMLNDGESVALVGPSGSGKTTLLSILGALQIGSKADVRLDGRAVQNHYLNSVFSWIFQTTNALSARTAIDNVALGLVRHGSSLREARHPALEMLSKVGLAQVAGRRARELSGGELQRVCIARALVGAPRFLFADEPTGNLDRAATDLVLDSLLAASGETGVLLATHDMRVAGRCDRRIELEAGRIVSDVNQ